MARQTNPIEMIKGARRVRLIFGLVSVMFAIFIGRLFYIQVINYGHYHKVAESDHLRKYTIPAKRGIIKAHQGDAVVPIVLNQTLYTLYADPVYVKNPDKIASVVAKTVGGNVEEYTKDLKQKDTRYVVLKKRISQNQRKKILSFKYPGIAATPEEYRIYPNGSSAAQLLGFVNSNGQGQYGVEQALNDQLKGKPGRVKAVTDVHGIPLAASPNNISVQPKSGDNVTLTIDMAMQKHLESILKRGKENGRARSASALILDTSNGAIKAMANYPTYDPAKYYQVNNPTVYDNGSTSHAIEVGSIMKTLTTAAALNQGVVTPQTSFYDPGHWTIDGFNITDVEASQGEQTMGSFLNLSLNTGATWLLMQMGGGKINARARQIWHSYMVKHFLLGQKTGIAQSGEDAGYIPPPQKNGAGIDLTYANTTFGQAMTATPLQMAAALASAVNGGTYYKPRLVDRISAPGGKTKINKPVVEKNDVVKPSTSKGLISLMQYVIEHHDNIVPQFDQSKYIVGGKTGTAQVAMPNGAGYYKDRYNATYLGFVGNDKPKYVIIVFVFDPDTSNYKAGFAGALTAQPIFVDLAHMLINNGYVAPKD